MTDCPQAEWPLSAPPNGKRTSRFRRPPPLLTQGGPSVLDQEQPLSWQIGTMLAYLDDDLALCSPCLDIRQSLPRSFEGKDPVDDRTDRSGFNEARDLAQLLAVRPHEKKRISHAMAFGFDPDTTAQQPQNQPQHHVQALFLGKFRIRRTADRDELSTRSQHAHRCFARLGVLTVQDVVVTRQDFLEIVLPVVDDNIGAEAFDQVGTRGV